MNTTDQLAQALEDVYALAGETREGARRLGTSLGMVEARLLRANEALAAHRASKEGEVEYRALVWNVDQFQKGDEFQVDGEWRPSPEKNYGLTYCGAYLPHRRPIRAT